MSSDTNQNWWQRFLSWFGWNKTKIPNEFEMRQQQIETAKALAMYEGYAPKPLAVEQGKPDDNVFVNYPQVIVDKGVAFLFGDGLKIECGDENQIEKADEFLEKVWSFEQRAGDLAEFGTDGAIFGTAFLKIVLETGKPRICVADPRLMSVDCDPEDYRRVVTFRCQYRRKSWADGKTEVWFKEETTREGKGWMIREFESTGGEQWTEIKKTAWNYDFPPYFAAKNLPRSKSFEGKPDLTRSVLELCRHLSRIDSLISKIVRLHASPKPWAKGLQPQELKIGTESVLFLGNNEKADLKLLEMTGDLGQALQTRKLFREALSEVSKVPEVATGKLESIGQLSGTAIRILYQPLIEQTNLKRRLYGRAIAECVRALLAIGKFGAELPVTLHWAEPVPTDPKEEAETAILWKQIGVSNSTLQQRNGFDPNAEAEKTAAERDALGNALGKAFDAGTGSDGQDFED